MHDLRKQALLESHKTVSRKARSKQSSMVSSRPLSAVNSRVASRNISRAGSDDEDGGALSDETSLRYVTLPSCVSYQHGIHHSFLRCRIICLNMADSDFSCSVNSNEDVLVGEDIDQPSESWRTELADRIEETIDRKRSSGQGRETTLASYIRILTGRYAEEQIRGKENDLVASFLKSIKTEVSEKETILALKGNLLSSDLKLLKTASHKANWCL